MSTYFSVEKQYATNKATARETEMKRVVQWNSDLTLLGCRAATQCCHLEAFRDEIRVSSSAESSSCRSSRA